jgi:DNA sulfur modification protein DndE
MPVDNIRLSQKAKDSLVNLKRKTHIENWNVLCRWAFCLSLNEPSLPPKMNHPADSNVEMSWKIFAGEYGELYWALLKQRCKKDELELTEEELALQFRLHLHRGIAYLSQQGQLPEIK